ncbi:hypothetical protein FOA43_000900 [Brettanomyces nanus]|uniref:Uncharacterized protein n=1 Tax=Eeniella nana TaxID=13502 RepID=A0A875RY36_EENNA|nr:uncharacterized protein FOA43_000900 [Brettanomyces nanus]QPG73588.1 hypothetical protein FOA43_000900 [Brettanomyces nanus]
MTPTAPSIGGIGPARPVATMGLIGSARPVGPIGPVGPVGLTGAVGHLGSIGQIGSMGPIGSIGHIGSLGHIGSIGQIRPVGSVSSIASMGRTGSSSTSGLGVTVPSGSNGLHSRRTTILPPISSLTGEIKFDTNGSTNRMQQDYPPKEFSPKTFYPEVPGGLQQSQRTATRFPSTSYSPINYASPSQGYVIPQSTFPFQTGQMAYHTGYIQAPQQQDSSQVPPQGASAILSQQRASPSQPQLPMGYNCEPYGYNSSTLTSEHDHTNVIPTYRTAYSYSTVAKSNNGQNNAAPLSYSGTARFAPDRRPSYLAQYPASSSSGSIYRMDLPDTRNNIDKQDSQIDMRHVERHSAPSKLSNEAFGEISMLNRDIQRETPKNVSKGAWRTPSLSTELHTPQREFSAIAHSTSIHEKSNHENGDTSDSADSSFSSSSSISKQIGKGGNNNGHNISKTPDSKLVVVMNTQSRKPRIRLSLEQQKLNELLASQYSDRNKRLGVLSSFKLRIDEGEKEDELNGMEEMQEIEQLQNFKDSRGLPHINLHKEPQESKPKLIENKLDPKNIISEMELSPEKVVQPDLEDDITSKASEEQPEKKMELPKRLNDNDATEDEASEQENDNTSELPPSPPKTIGSVAATVEKEKQLQATQNIVQIIPRTPELTCEQASFMQKTNTNVVKSLSLIKNSQELVEQLKKSFPTSATLPAIPAIPEGFIPMMMSPQGLLIPMQYAPVVTEDHIIPTVKPVWEGDMLEILPNSENSGSDSKVATVFSADEPVPSLNMPRKRVMPQARTKKRAKLSNTDKLAAIRLCLISEECYARCHVGVKMQVEITPVVLSHKEMVDYYTWLGSDSSQQLKNYVSRKSYYITKFNSLNEEIENEKRNKSMVGLEKDLMEIRDYDIVREELFCEYRNDKAFSQYLDELLATYSSICLDYTTRLLKFKKFLLRNRHALTGNKDQMFYVNSSKSEKLWRNFVKEERRVKTQLREKFEIRGRAETDAEATDGASGLAKDVYNAQGARSQYMTLPNMSGSGSGSGAGKRNTTNTSLSSPESSSSASVAVSRISRRMRGSVAITDKLQTKFPISDELAPMLSDVDFFDFTDYKSKLYEQYILRSGYSEVADQSDIVELIEFFRVKSLLSDLCELMKYDGRSSRHNSPDDNSVSPHNDPYAKYYPIDEENGVSLPMNHSSSSSILQKNLKKNGLNVISSLDTRVADGDRVKYLTLDEKEIRAKFTKAYTKPMGLSNEEIVGDLRVLAAGSKYKV